MRVVLSPFEMRVARSLGNLRQQRREAAGNKRPFGGGSGGAADHIQGLMGEMAFAKLANRYPSGLFLDMDEDNDVGGIQVRTRRKNYMELYLWATDPLDCYWALMTGEGPEFTFHGLIRGEDAALDSNWTEAAKPFPLRACWIVPGHQLRVELLDEIGASCVSP
jgi:hypothetical protein